MGRFNYLNSNFLLGECSPRMLGRSDLKEYYQMSQEQLNTLIFRQGGATRRPGTQFQLKSLHNTAVPGDVTLGPSVRLLPFVFSKTEQYMMVLFLPSECAANSVGIALYNIQTGTHIADLGGGASAPGIDDQRDVTSGFKYFDAFTTLAQLQAVQVAQSGDVISFVGHGKAPFFLIRKATNLFTFVDIYTVRNFLQAQRAPTHDNYTPPSTKTYESVPYVFAPGFVGQTITLAATSGNNVSVTWTGNGGVAPVADGTLIRVDGGSTTGFGILQNGGTKMNVLKTWPNTTANAYRVSAWNDTYGYPNVNCFYQQRLIYANNTKFPDTMWGSQQADLTLMMEDRTVDDANYTVATSNDRPFSFTIAQNELDDIRWLSGGQDLFVGTSGGEWIASGTDPSLSLGPLNVGFNLQTTYGSEKVAAIRSDGAVHFAQRGGLNVREVVFDFRENHRLAYDMNYFAEHITKKGLLKRASYAAPKIIQMAYQALEDNITWCLDSNGCFFGLTRDRMQQVQAWHWHSLGGIINTSEIPYVTSIACAPSINGDYDELWLAVKRHINGADVTYIEKMGKPYRFSSVFNSSTDIQDKIILADCAKMVRLGGTGTTFSGFDHLEGQTVDVVCDGNYLGTFTVSSGNISVGGLTNYKECIAGLVYKARIRPMPATWGSVMGSGDSTPKRIDRAIFRFQNTVNASYGKTDDASLMSIPFRDSSVPNGTATPMFTGIKSEMYQGPIEGDADICIVSDRSLPMTLTSLTLRGNTYEG